MNQMQMRGSAATTTYRCDRGGHPQEGGKAFDHVPVLRDAMPAIRGKNVVAKDNAGQKGKGKFDEFPSA
jgi:hypothetical protein